MNRHDLDNTIRWRCRRGLLELDIMLQSFLEIKYDDLSLEEAQLFEQLLEIEDNPLMDILMADSQHRLQAHKQFSHVIKSIQQATLSSS